MDVMAAVLILGLFIMPLLIARNNSIASATETVNLRVANLLAVRKMGELSLEDPTSLAASSGDFSEGYSGFTWETEVETVLVEDLVPEEVEEEEELWGYGEQEEEEDEGADIRKREVVILTLRVRYPSPLVEEGADLPTEPAEGEEKVRPPGQVELVWLLVPAVEEGEDDAGESGDEAQPAQERELLDLFGPAPTGAGTPPEEGSDEEEEEEEDEAQEEE
jgi:hypothetical protein